MFSSKKQKIFRLSVACILLLSFMISKINDVKAQEQAADIGFFASYEVSPAKLIQVPVTIRNVEDLYGIDIQIEFDPEILQVVDSDPQATGTQISLGDFLDPGLLLFNTVDNESGFIRFVMTQYNPSTPKSGEGVILLINFVGKTEGNSPLSITKLQLVSSQATVIPSTVVESSITVKNGAPTQSSTLITVDPTGLIFLYTPTPSETPNQLISTTGEDSQETITPQQVTPQPADQKSTETIKEIAVESDSTNYWLIHNWWILVLLFVVVVVLAIFYVLKKNANKERIIK